MTLEEWRTCDEAWWVDTGKKRVRRAKFTGEIEPTSADAEFCRMGTGVTRWYYCTGIDAEYWFATEAEAVFYTEVLL